MQEQLHCVLTWQHINDWMVWLSVQMQVLMHKKTHHCHHATTVMVGKVCASKVFRDKQRSKKADCCWQFDHLLLGMGSPLPDWNRHFPGDLRPHWTGKEGTVIISWANPKLLPISLFPTRSCTILDVSLAAPMLKPCWHAVNCVLIY